MGNVQLSQKVKKLSKDFVLEEGQFKMSMEKMKKWVDELDKVADGDKPKIAQELIALALKFEREGKEGASVGAAQLYFFAAGLIKPTAQAAAPSKAAPSKPAPAAKKPPARPESKSGGWGAKSKR